MNCILFSQAELQSDGTVELTDYRCTHIREILKLTKSDRIKCGVRQGLMGTAEIISENAERILIRPELTSPPPPPLPVKLIVAMPRPKSFRKLLHTAVVMGVKEIHLIKSWRVDKSYWSTPFLTAEGLDEIVLDGLMQTRDTMAPTVTVHKSFKPFVEDSFPSIAMGTEVHLFHPAESAQKLSVKQGRAYTIIIGPEGGFIPYEVELFAHHGAITTTLGPRIQRVEQAVGSVLGFISMSM